MVSLCFPNFVHPLKMEDDKKPTEYLFHDEFEVEWLYKMLCFVALNAELYGKLLLRRFNCVQLCATP